MNTVVAAFTVGRVELLRRLRDHSFVLQGIVGPVVIAVIVGLAFGGSDQSGSITVGILDEDGTAESAALVDGLITVAADQEGFSLERVDSREAARQGIDDSGGAVLVVPAGFVGNTRVPEPVPFEVMADPNDPVPRAVAESVAGDLATRFSIGRTVVAGLFASGEPVPVDMVAAAIDAGAAPVTLDDRPIDDWDPLTYFAPAMALMFLFFAIGAVARSILTDERLGVLPRLRASPFPSSALLWGRGVSSLVMVVLSMLSVLVVIGLAFGADLGPLRLTVPVLLAGATTVAGLAALIAGLARTEAQADGWTSVIAFGLALAGGAFVSPGSMPDALRSVSRFTPNGRALQTHVDLVAGAAGGAEALRAVLVLAAFTAVSGGIGLCLQRRRLSRVSWDPIAAVCRSELLRTVRDRTALFFALLLPVILISMSAVLFGGESAVALAVFDPAGAVAAELEQDAAVTVIEYDRADELERDVVTGRADAGLLVAEAEGLGYTGRLLIDPTRSGTDSARFAARDALRTVAAFDITVDTLQDLQGLDEVDAERAAETVSDVEPVGVETTFVGVAESAAEDARTYSVLGNLVLFMFINSLAIGGQLVSARQLGVLRRSLAAPVSPAGLAAGFVVARFLFALLQAAILVVVGAVLFDVDFGDPFAVAAIVVLFALVSAAAGLIMGTRASSPDQAAAIGVPVGIGLAMLGGCMWPLFIVPDAVRQVGHLTPHAWAVDGLVSVVFGEESISGIGAELAILIGFVAVLGLTAMRSLRRITAA